jgi:hypothetical protein
VNTKKAEMSLGLFAILGIFVVAPVLGGLIVATVKLGPVAVPIWIAVAGAGAFVMRGRFGEALAAQLNWDDTPELDGEAMVELEDLRARVAELEERQDFSERMLTKQGEPMRLEGPSA